MSDSGSEMPARLHFVSYGNGSYIFKDKKWHRTDLTMAQVFVNSAKDIR